VDTSTSWNSLSLGLEIAIALAEKRDTHALTHAFIAQLEALPFVSTASAYEIFGDTTKATGEASDFSELVVQRFPRFLQTQDKAERTQLLREYSQCDSLTLIPLDAGDDQQLAILPISDGAGPIRMVIAECRGAVDQRILSRLHTLYEDLIHNLDSKERDVLTELLNRQTFDQNLMLVSQALRKNRVEAHGGGGQSWLAMLDIDHFKRINDSYGHLYGDEILVLFSGLMKQWFRYTDFLFRYGGEEFAVILNQTDHAGAEHALTRFRHAVADYEFPSVGGITTSGGYCEIDPKVLPGTLIDQADKALYYAKQHGRNRIIRYDDAFGPSGHAVEGPIELF